MVGCVGALDGWLDVLVDGWMCWWMADRSKE